ncbi:folylpolyglutamate synthase isoform X1 [Ananas comosus]|uniref:Folylpolyglutamate synthase n=1 Tax=Ananas comosus TaxID=4615 RepID=A0A6P5F2J0_ANACO|nr:folylpolyglutamate synthase isoform X1 [Ananas comosus]
MEDKGRLQEVDLSSSYEAAMEALSSLISRQKRGTEPKKAGKFGLMFKYLQVAGLDKSISELKIMHVAGTKGKGSTCTFSEAILRECGLQTGLFTSPHLIDITERFRINGSDISREKFLYYFWGLWHQLKEKNVDGLLMPPLFQFLTLLAFKIFLCEKVDVAIVEVGIGGRWDSTNVIKQPVVCGITSLGMDHMEILGDTIEKIAAEKAGIFKHSVPAFTVPQLEQAMSVLTEESSKLSIPLEVAPPLDSEKLKGLKLGLAGEHQYINAGLAVALCKCWLQRTGYTKVLLKDDLEGSLPEEFLRGLSTANLFGRAQIVNDKPEKFDENSELNGYCGNLIFYLDSAHTPESLEACAKWFSNALWDNQHPTKNDFINEPHGNSDSQCSMKHCNQPERISKKILLFNCMEKRDPQLLLPQLMKTCTSSGVQFSKALFVPSISTYHRVDSATSPVPSNPSGEVSWQSTLQRTWEKLIHRKDVTTVNGLKLHNTHNSSSNGFIEVDPLDKCDLAGNHYICSAVIPSLPMAINWLRECARENPSIRFQVLVTGSLHLVGDVLKLLRR